MPTGQVVNRAAGELGIVAFLEGNTAQAQAMVGKALVSAMTMGDLAGQIRQLSLIGVGLTEIGLPERALPYLDQALKLASKDKHVRFPLMSTGHVGARIWTALSTRSRVGSRPSPGMPRSRAAPGNLTESPDADSMYRMA